MQKHSQQTTISFIVVLVFLYAWISINIYLPALPTLIHTFNTDPHHLKLSITLFFISYGIAQLIWGPFSEKYGRRCTLILGISITAVGALLTMFAQNVALFNVGRVIEAAGLACASVLGRAVLVDILDTKKLLKAMTFVMFAVNLMPAIAPIIGGNLLRLFGWQSIFLFLFLYSMILIGLFIFKLPETHENIQKHLHISDMLKSYRALLSNRQFMGYVLIYVLGNGAMMGYYALAPFLFISKLHISVHTYGYLGFVTVGAYLLGILATRLCASRLSLAATVKLSTRLLLLATLISVLISQFSNVNVFSVLTSFALYTFSIGLMAPNANIGAMKSAVHASGPGASILTSGVYTCSAIFSSIATTLPLHSLLPLALYIGVVALSSWYLCKTMITED